MNKIEISIAWPTRIVWTTYVSFPYWLLNENQFYTWIILSEVNYLLKHLFSSCLNVCCRTLCGFCMWTFIEFSRIISMFELFYNGAYGRTLYYFTWYRNVNNISIWCVKYLLCILTISQPPDVLQYISMHHQYIVIHNMIYFLLMFYYRFYYRGSWMLVHAMNVWVFLSRFIVDPSLLLITWKKKW